VGGEVVVFGQAQGVLHGLAVMGREFAEPFELVQVAFEGALDDGGEVLTQLLGVYGAAGLERLHDSGQLWKNLLRLTCTVKLWEGEKERVSVHAWEMMWGCTANRGVLVIVAWEVNRVVAGYI
jgi:hypothetical protein